MKKDFEHLVATFESSIKTWDYFVKWENAFANSAELEIALNKLNYLIGKDDLQKEFIILYKSNPDITKAFPALLAIRDKSLEVYDKVSRNTETYDFSGQDYDPEKYFRFFEQTGLIKLFKRDGVKNLVDYVIGVEVGLDTHGRKNRGGSLMEEIVGQFIEELSRRNGFEYLAQARPSAIKRKWGVEVKVDKTERSFDFAVFNPRNKKIKLFETNFYNGGGSKLKATCGEFRVLHDELKSQNIDFVWVTDGLGWHTTKRPLEETYNHNDYIFNLSMLESGILNELPW